MRAIKKINGSLLISPWKRKKQKNCIKSYTEKPLPEVSILSRGVARTFQRRGGGSH